MLPCFSAFYRILITYIFISVAIFFFQSTKQNDKSSEIISLAIYLNFFNKSLLVSGVSEALLECDRLRIRGGKESVVVLTYNKAYLHPNNTTFQNLQVTRHSRMFVVVRRFLSVIAILYINFHNHSWTPEDEIGRCSRKNGMSIFTLIINIRSCDSS